MLLVSPTNNGTPSRSSTSSHSNIIHHCNFEKEAYQKAHRWYWSQLKRRSSQSRSKSPTCANQLVGIYQQSCSIESIDSANQGEVIRLDTDLDEMEGIISKDHAAMQVRRASSFSGAPNFLNSPFHPDPFNSGRILGSPNCAPRNPGLHEAGQIAAWEVHHGRYSTPGESAQSAKSNRYIKVQKISVDPDVCPTKSTKNCALFPPLILALIHPLGNPLKEPGTPRSGVTSEEDEADQAVRITIKSIGLQLGSNESSRRQWIALRVDSPHIRVPKPRKRSNSFDSSSDSSEPEFSSAEASYRYERSRKISAASSISQLSGLSKSDAPQIDFLKTVSPNSTQASSSILRHLPPQARPAICFLRKLLRLARLEIVRPLLNKLNRFGRRLSWIISVFGVEVNDIQVDVNEICRVTCSIKTGLQLSRGDDGKICCWIVIKKLQVHKVTPFDHSASPSKEDTRLHHTGRDTTAAFSFPGCIEISASAGLDPVIGLASIWAGTKPRGYNRQAFYPSSMSDGSWKRYIRPRSVNIALKISDDLQAIRRTSKKTNFFPNLKASSAFISVENGLAMRAIPHQTKTEDTDNASPSISTDEPMFPSSNFSHLEEPEHSPSNVFSIVSNIRQFQISLPSLHCYYILSGPIPSPNSTSSANPGPCISQNKRVAIDLQITRFLMNLDLSAEKTGKESSRSGRNLITHRISSPTDPPSYCGCRTSLSF